MPPAAPRLPAGACSNDESDGAGELPGKRQPLYHTHTRKEHWRPYTYGSVSGKQPDTGSRNGHHQQGKRKCKFPAVLIAESAEKQSPNGPHEEACGKDTVS